MIASGTVNDFQVDLTTIEEVLEKTLIEVQRHHALVTLFAAKLEDLAEDVRSRKAPAPHKPSEIATPPQAPPVGSTPITSQENEHAAETPVSGHGQS